MSLYYMHFIISKINFFVSLFHINLCCSYPEFQFTVFAYRNLYIGSDGLSLCVFFCSKQFLVGPLLFEHSSQIKNNVQDLVHHDVQII